MTSRLFDAVLTRQTSGAWGSAALELPSARLVQVFTPTGAPLDFHANGGKVVLDAETVGMPVARIELSRDLVEASALEKAKVEFDRVKLESEERSGRRTLIISLATAVVSALATVAVALIANLGGGPPSKPPAPTSYRDLIECRESLHRLTTLASIPLQTLSTMRDAITRHAQDCDDRLDAAILASPS